MNSVLPFVLLHIHSFLFSILCSGIVGTGVVQAVDMLGFGVSGTHFGKYYVIKVFWYVT